MDLPFAFPFLLSTAALIDECRATVQYSRLVRKQGAAVLSETVEQLAILRHNVSRLAKMLATSAMCSVPQVHSGTIASARLRPSGVSA